MSACQIYIFFNICLRLAIHMQTPKKKRGLAKAVTQLVLSEITTCSVSEGSAPPAQAEECLGAGSKCIPAAEEPRKEGVKKKLY